MIAEKKGLLIYLRQEGRGIGIINKIKAYKHQENGLDTIEANEALGLKSDYRNYTEAVEILKQMEIKKILLITNNPDKIAELEEGGIEVIDRIPVIIAPNQQNLNYLKTKRKSMGHLL
jgi:3,4-dihydroxy 2-butanone 4-phosphate synthase/GTP cyclohydrolase II